jgi:hypothetical protein
VTLCFHIDKGNTEQGYEGLGLVLTLFNDIFSTAYVANDVEESDRDRFEDTTISGEAWRYSVKTANLLRIEPGPHEYESGMLTNKL